MNQPKYISKQVIHISENVTVSKYFYNWGARVFINDKRREEPLAIDIHLAEIFAAIDDIEHKS